MSADPDEMAGPAGRAPDWRPLPPSEPAGPGLPRDGQAPAGPTPSAAGGRRAWSPLPAIAVPEPRREAEPASEAEPAPAAGAGPAGSMTSSTGSGGGSFSLGRLVKPRPQRPGHGLRRLVWAVTRGRINLGPSMAEQVTQQLIFRVRTPAAGGGRRIAFVSLKGGVGKTTTTVMLGHTLAAHRGDNVIAVDANPDAGNLASRVHRETPAAARDLLRASDSLARYADVRTFTSQAESRLQVLAGESDPALSEAFGASDYSSVLGALERFYSVVLTDCGTGILHDAMRAVLCYADQLVVVTSPALDSAQALNQLLDWLDQHGYHQLVQGSIVVVNGVRRADRVSAEQFAACFGPRCRAVAAVPFDKALAAGGEVELGDLGGATRRAYLDLAAVVGDGFATSRPHAPPRF